MSKADEQKSAEALVEEKLSSVTTKTREFTGLPSILMKAAYTIFALFAIYIVFLSPFDTRINRAAFVGYIVAMIFLNYPASQKMKRKTNHIPIYDIVLAALALISYGYFVFNCAAVIKIGATIPPLLIVLGIIGVILTLEACRRANGLPIVVVASGFIIFGFVNKYLHYIDRGKALEVALNGTLQSNIYNLFYTTEGVIGTPIRACTAFISLFVIFGAFLEKTSISEFFIDLANSIAGASVGGPAKVSVISSALCGMVSGSSVGNTVTTGAITIPLMKKNGYRPEFAGAVEAASSTGGQIMPPIMGAAAFLMIEYTGQEYGFIALRACLPAFLYFTGIFIAVHLEAKRLGLKGLSKDQLPKFGVIIKSWYLVLPLVALTYLIIKSTMAMAAIVAIAIAVALSMIKKETRMTPAKIVAALVDGAKNVIGVGIACSVAGIIACIITTTGIGNMLISGIVALAGGKLIIGMFLTMITCIILGMGVPTTANYVIMATTCAPILIKMGMNEFAAHMFVFYFGIVADITPPVALAAYAGAAIAGASAIKTAVNATILAIAAFIVPYIFGLNPALLFIDTTPLAVVVIVITSVVGIFGVAAGLRGYALRPMNWLFRIIMVVGGLLLIYPGTITDIIGCVAVIGTCAIQYMQNKSLKVKA